MILDLLHSEDSRDKPLTEERIWKQLPEPLRKAGATRKIIMVLLKQLQKSGMIKKVPMGYIPSREK